MSDFKGTPGPWKWFTSNSHNRLSSLIFGQDGHVLYAYADGNGFPHIGCNKEDMKLIAAAPELLEALQEVVSAMEIILRVGHERIIELGGQCDPPEVMLKGHSEIARAKAAIAKALGQTQ